MAGGVVAIGDQLPLSPPRYQVTPALITDIIYNCCVIILNLIMKGPIY